jgi:tetratricopeptide (TPR) repeat protein
LVDIKMVAMGNVVIAGVVLGSILLLGLGVMLWAYRGSGSRAVIFPVPVALPESSQPASAAVEQPFQAGVKAFQAGDYRRSLACFQQVTQVDPASPEARHNLGLALANLRQDNEAVASLVRAGELYAQQEKGEAIALLKQHLELLQGRDA